MPDGTPARLTEAGSFGLFGHPHCQGAPVVLVGLTGRGVAREVWRVRTASLIGTYVGPHWYFLEGR